jgi:hypothetical protein
VRESSARCGNVEGFISTGIEIVYDRMARFMLDMRNLEVWPVDRP